MSNIKHFVPLAYCLKKSVKGEKRKHTSHVHLGSFNYFLIHNILRQFVE